MGGGGGVIPCVAVARSSRLLSKQLLKQTKASCERKKKKLI